jgi:hypothetical protein
MENVPHYREQAERTRRLARAIVDPEVKRRLNRLAQDYDEIAEDLKAGGEIRHPDLMPLG